MRTYQHIIDTMAVRQVINAIPEYCVVRELTERDYGIDLMIELFVNTGKNNKGHDNYDTTGHVCYLQIKGTDKVLRVKNNAINFTIDKKSLFYVEKFSTPFILTRVCTVKGKEVIYFVWLQRYISDVLDINDPTWRKDKTKSITINIPEQNILSDNFGKVAKIAWRIKYLEELAEFHETYTDIMMTYYLIIKYQDEFEHFLEIITKLRRLTNLSTLLTNNHCCIDKDDILELIDYLKGVRNGLNSPIEMEDLPNYYNLNLLRESTLSTRSSEEMVADIEDDTIY